MLEFQRSKREQFTMGYNGIEVPKDGAKITLEKGQLNGPNNPIIPLFIIFLEILE